MYLKRHAALQEAPGAHFVDMRFAEYCDMGCNTDDLTTNGIIRLVRNLEAPLWRRCMLVLSRLRSKRLSRTRSGQWHAQALHLPRLRLVLRAGQRCC